MLLGGALRGSLVVSEKISSSIPTILFFLINGMVATSNKPKSSSQISLVQPCFVLPLHYLELLRQ